MQKIRRSLGLFAALFAASALLVSAQDAPSLGDVARQTRQQKKQSQDAQSKTGQNAKKPKVINDEDVAHSAPDETAATSSDDHAAAEPVEAPAGKVSPEQWRSKIEAQKNAVAALQEDIDKLDKSIQFAPGNCVAGCVQWNEHQKEKQQEVERMREELKTQQKNLDDMQEAARQQGYGSSITDP
jgi:hypothetical protein